MEEKINKLKEFDDTKKDAGFSFATGDDCWKSWLAYEVGMILGLDLEKPEEPDYDY